MTNHIESDGHVDHKVFYGCVARIAINKSWLIDMRNLPEQQSEIPRIMLLF